MVNMLKHNKNYFFKSPIYIKEHTDVLDNLNLLCDSYIEKEKQKDIEKINDRNKLLGQIGDKGWHYHSEPLYLDKNFSDFHKLIGNNARFILDDMGYDITNHKLVFTESWVQEFSEKGSANHHIHAHGNNHISGFYFLKISNKTSFPIFTDPRIGHTMMKLPEKNKDDITDATDILNLKPSPGTLIMFPSYLAHGYQVDLGIEPFRFIHFNLRAIESIYLND